MKLRPGLTHPSTFMQLAAAALVFALLTANTAAWAEESRIVALGGSITEILYALGAQDRIVGVDSTSLAPPSALQEKPSVGYVRAISAEGVLSLKPTLVLAIEGAGPPAALELIRAAGAPLEIVPDAPTPEGIRRKIEILGETVGAKDAAAKLNREVGAGFAALEGLRARITKPVRALFVLSFANGRTLVGGRNTSAASMLALAGAVNAAEDVDGYKPMTDEAIASAAPDFVLMMKNGDHHVDAETVFASPAFALTPAARTRALLALDGLFLLGFGPRTPDAARELIEAFYPSLATAAP
ncbi:heme/hemin ABC transporter substrate-binding protein [Methylocella silvestris]|uniref:heme/hemin ABC transporter substrate-binding protein n=1 Tax=Methylocella silvestris TaxID=199596 RepID=UPI001FCB0923|nr:ABC transporter substrate-binding protein [Methylocella silvestris]